MTRTQDPTGAGSTSADPRGARRRARGRAVLLGILASSAVWLVAVPLAGMELRSPTPNGSRGFDIGVVIVIGATALVSLAGWALLATLERVTRQAAAAWTAIAGVVLVGSLAGPLTGAGVGARNRAVLVAMHLVVGAVVIPLLSRTARSLPAGPVTR